MPRSSEVATLAWTDNLRLREEESKVNIATIGRGLGGLEKARALEDFVPGVFMKLAPGFYRFAAPGEL